MSGDRASSREGGEACVLPEQAARQSRQGRREQICRDAARPGGQHHAGLSTRDRRRRAPARQDPHRCVWVIWIAIDIKTVLNAIIIFWFASDLFTLLGDAQYDARYDDLVREFRLALGRTLN